MSDVALSAKEREWMLAMPSWSNPERGFVDGAAIVEKFDELQRKVAEFEIALHLIAEQQPETLLMIETNGFVFTDIGQELGNWQHLAFSIYTDLCQVDSIARGALK